MSRIRHEEILGHINKCGHITNRDAVLEYDNHYLPKRISELRGAGFDIVSTQQTNKISGKQYTRYSFAKGSPKSYADLKRMQSGRA